MTEAVLTLNAGSSSLKVALFGASGETPLLTGQADRIGPQGSLQLRRSDGSAIEVPPTQIRSHEDALKAILEGLSLAFPQLTLAAIGHRVVHGGERYTEPKRITPEVMEYLATLEPFAPLHQPHNLAGIRTAMATFGEVPQVACFDTAFHRGHPFVNDSFALPYRYFEKGVRRYGFHGLSYDYVSGHLRQIAPRLAEGRVVVAHLGNGASMCGISNGRSVASTMGFSALDGLPMGTRCGQIDPGVLLFMLDQEGLTSEQIRHTLYSESGLLGLSGGLSNDMRSLEASDTPEAKRAIDYFVFRVQREVGAMAAAMGGIDALIFCGGIGEHSSLVRARVCERMGWMGIEVDHHLNQVHAQVISTELSRTTVMVIPTQEELVIARAARVIADL
jgi:acetate kinase